MTTTETSRDVLVMAVLQGTLGCSCCPDLSGASVKHILSILSANDGLAEDFREHIAETAGAVLPLVEGAITTMRRGVKTRDVGQCADCGGHTSSGMNPFCDRCASKHLDGLLDWLRNLAALPAPALEDRDVRDAAA
jgi:hypothetical protein